MAPNDVKSVAYLDVPSSAIGDNPMSHAVAFTCAECVRNGAKNVRVYRSQSGMDTHLKNYHGK